MGRGPRLEEAGFADERAQPEGRSVQSGQSSERLFLLQTTHAGPRPPTPASQSLGPPCLSHPGLLLLCVRFSSQAGRAHTHQGPGLTGEGWTQRPADGMSVDLHRYGVCVLGPRGQMTTDSGAPVNIDCNLWSQESEINLLGPKTRCGGCVPPGAQGRLGLCLFSFWRRLHSLAHRPPSIVKPVESASPSQAALAPSWLGELSAQGVVGLGGALILRAGTAVTPAEPRAPDAAGPTSWSWLLGSISAFVHVCVCPRVRETPTLWTWDHVLCLKFPLPAQSGTSSPCHWRAGWRAPHPPHFFVSHMFMSVLMTRMRPESPRMAWLWVLGDTPCGMQSLLQGLLGCRRHFLCQITRNGPQGQ